MTSSRKCMGSGKKPYGGFWDSFGNKHDYNPGEKGKCGYCGKRLTVTRKGLLPVHVPR